MKQNSHFKDEQNTFILKFEEIKEQVLIILEKLLKITTSQITTSHLNSMQTAIQQDCENILQELNNSSIKIEENANVLTSQSADLSLLKSDVSSLLNFVPSDLKDILNNIESIINELPSKTLSQTELDELEARLNISLTNLHNEILSDNLGEDEPLNLEDRLKALLSNIYSLCESIQTSVNETVGISTKIEELEANVLTLQNAINSMQTNLDTALQYIKDNGSLIEPEAPFNPPPDTILCTRSVAYPWRKYFGSLSVINFSPEYFVVNNDSPAVIKIEYDFEVDELIENVVSEVYLNDELVDSITFNAEIGTKRIAHTAIFQQNRTDGHFQVKVYSEANTYRFISNIKYEIVGDNAVLLRENLPVTYDLLLCGNDYYFTKNTSSSLEYMHTSVINTTFTENYQSLASVDRKYRYMPVILVKYDTSQKTCTLLRLTYIRFEMSTNVAEICDPETHLKKSSYNALIKGMAPDIVEIGSIYVSNYQACTMMYQDTLNSYANFSFYVYLSASSGSVVNTVTKKYVDFEFLNNCITSKGVSPSTKVYLLCQDNTGSWFLEQRDNLENHFNFNLGFGTKVKFSYCTTFLGEASTRKYCYRVFMFVYDHWVAKYFEILSDNLTCNFLKAKVIEGDFDQILPGSGNEYFTVKDGSITKHIDEDIMSLDVFVP